MSTRTKRNRDQKRLEQLLVDGIELCKLAGQAQFGVGLHCAQVATGPKRAAASLLAVAGKFRLIAEGVEKLAESIVIWDSERLITKVENPLVGLDGQPIKQ
jgi:hypothetical protein